MKILVAPGTVQITSKLGRIQHPNRPTGRPPCFSQIWLDCTENSIYLVFSDGSIYHYDANSIDVGRALIRAFNHGVTFNSTYRLFGISGSIAPYERVASIPSTAVMDYAFPPYPGTDPGPCPSNVFDEMVWTNVVLGTGVTIVLLDPPTGNAQDNATSHVTGGVHLQNSITANDGALTYTGPGGVVQVDWQLDVSGAVPFGQSVGINLVQNSTVLTVHNFNVNGTFSGTDFPTLAPGVGADQTVTAQVVCNTQVSNIGGLDLLAMITLTKFE
jgi:hypothetical protein